MRHMRRITCPMCDGAGVVPDDDMSPGWRVCGHCMGHGIRSVDAEAPCCDTMSHDEITPAEPLL